MYKPRTLIMKLKQLQNCISYGWKDEIYYTRDPIGTNRNRMNVESQLVFKILEKNSVKDIQRS